MLGNTLMEIKLHNTNTTLRMEFIIKWLLNIYVNRIQAAQNTSHLRYFLKKVMESPELLIFIENLKSDQLFMIKTLHEISQLVN
jgi:hypothetical protein